MGGGRIVWGLVALAGCSAAESAVAPISGLVSEPPAAAAAGAEQAADSDAVGELAIVLVAADGARWELRDGEDLEAWLAGVTTAPPAAGMLVLSARADQEFQRLRRVMQALGDVGRHDVALRLGVD